MRPQRPASATPLHITNAIQSIKEGLPVERIVPGHTGLRRRPQNSPTADKTPWRDIQRQGMREPDPLRQPLKIDSPDRMNVQAQAHALLTGLHRAHPAFYHCRSDHLLHRRRGPCHRMDLGHHRAGHGPHHQDENKTEPKAFCMSKAEKYGAAGQRRQRNNNEQRRLERDRKIDNRTETKSECEIERTIQNEV